MFATLKQTYLMEYQKVQYAFKDSMIHCICNSHYLSHFAAFFIDAWTKRSIAESFIIKLFINHYNYYSYNFQKHSSKHF